MGQLMLVNPRRRRATTKRRTPKRAAPRRAVARRRRRNPIAVPTARRVVRRRRNPISTSGIIRSQVKPAITAATGALALNIMWGFLPIPANLQMGPLRYLAKGAGAIAMGMLAGNVVNRQTAQAMSTGALTVIIHDAMREVTQSVMPSVPLGYYSAGHPVNGMGQYVNGLGEYMPGSMSTYLDNTLSTPFAGPSPMAEMERRMTEECGGGSY